MAGRKGQNEQHSRIWKNQNNGIFDVRDFHRTLSHIQRKKKTIIIIFCIQQTCIVDKLHNKWFECELKMSWSSFYFSYHFAAICKTYFYKNTDGFRNEKGKKEEKEMKLLVMWCEWEWKWLFLVLCSSFLCDWSCYLCCMARNCRYTGGNFFNDWEFWWKIHDLLWIIIESLKAK